MLVVIGFYLAFTKSIPFTSPGYQVNATFSNAVNIAINSPIRIAGINVGKVTDVEPAGDNYDRHFHCRAKRAVRFGPTPLLRSGRDFFSKATGSSTSIPALRKPTRCRTAESSR